MIAIGCDHGGFPLKKEIIKFLESAGYEYEDFGTYSEESCDYPVYAKKVAHAVADGKCDKGIIICGTGTRSRALEPPSFTTASPQKPQGSTTTPTSLPWAQGSSAPALQRK